MRWMTQIQVWNIERLKPCGSFFPSQWSCIHAFNLPQVTIEFFKASSSLRYKFNVLMKTYITLASAFGFSILWFSRLDHITCRVLYYLFSSPLPCSFFVLCSPLIFLKKKRNEDSNMFLHYENACEFCDSDKRPFRLWSIEFGGKKMNFAHLNLIEFHFFLHHSSFQIAFAQSSACILQSQYCEVGMLPMKIWPHHWKPYLYFL